MPEAGYERVHPEGLPIHLMHDRCLVMGVVNVTPDSFSDGGRFWDRGTSRTSPEQDTIQAVEHGLRLAECGADIVDVGGESTRPGAERIAPDEEIRRVVPVVRELASAGICVSVDTMRATTAASAVQAGATIVNDVSGGLADPDMLATVAQYEGPYVLMHWRGHSTEMSDRAIYQEVVTDVSAEINKRVEAAMAAGIERERLVIDPGLGFAKKSVHNWALLRGLGDLTSTGLPVLVGASRKRFLGALLADDNGPRPVSEREPATLAVSTLAARSGAWCLRVHDVAPSADAVRVVKAWLG